MLLLAAATTIALLPSPANAGDTVTRWENFSESTTCGSSYTRTPFVSRRGSLSNGEVILGPYGTYFGRSISEIRSQLVSWRVPNSGGQTVLVHQEVLPSLNEVTATLAQEAAQGNVYGVQSVAAFVPRTISGSYQLSRHAIGLAIDINPAQNPYRSDNKLITNMPNWFVQAWTEAGFCWGGNWKYAKDPMHFSWMGPGRTPANDMLDPSAPKTTKTSFGIFVAQKPSEFAGVVGRYGMGVVDASGNSAPDLVGLRAHPDGSVIDIANSMLGYGACSITRWFIPDKSLARADHTLFADVNGDSGTDLITLTTSGSTLTATVATRSQEFLDVATQSTGLGSDAVALTGADFDGDHVADLWEVTPAGDIRILKGPAWINVIHSSTLPGGPPERISAGDRDGGDTPEIYALYPDGSDARVDVLRLDSTWTIVDSIGIAASSDSVAALGSEDYDGDGRSDLQLFGTDAKLIVYVGNSSTGIALDRWFLKPNRECDDNPVVLSFSGTFSDDENSIFEANIESIAATGVTKGCNPPFNDRFCPKDVVTRETMAAFIVRALNLTENTHPGFTDVDPGGIFAEDIGRLATAGITKGCNPPNNDRFCPNDSVTRETMAAFIVRALDLKDSSHPGFMDVPGSSIFAHDITRLATAGITKGCNPPSNDLYCPKDLVTRETMAAFLDRAGLGG